MAYILENRSLERVYAIASLCERIDPSWRDELNTKTEEEAIEECFPNLQKLVSVTYECCALFFDRVRFRTDFGNYEKKDLIPFHIRHKNAPLECDDARVMPADEEISDFYLLHAGSIYHIVLNPDSPIILEFSSENNVPWDMSTSKVQQMSSKKWDRCFVSGSYSWANVISIPAVTAGCNIKAGQL